MFRSKRNLFPTLTYTIGAPKVQFQNCSISVQITSCWSWHRTTLPIFRFSFFLYSSPLVINLANISNLDLPQKPHFFSRLNDFFCLGVYFFIFAFVNWIILMSISYTTNCFESSCNNETLFVIRKNTGIKIRIIWFFFLRIKKLKFILKPIVTWFWLENY